MVPDGGGRRYTVVAISSFCADAQVSPFFLLECCSETSRGKMMVRG